MKGTYLISLDSRVGVVVRSNPTICHGIVQVLGCIWIFIQWTKIPCLCYNATVPRTPNGGPNMGSMQ